MTSADSSPNAADAIADALSRLRGRSHGPSRPHGGAENHPHSGGPHGHGHGRGPWGHGGRGDFPARLRMLDALRAAGDPLSVSDLAAAIGVDQPRASRLVQQGVENGWVRREADPDDARRTRIALTDEGTTMLRGIRGRRRDRLERALADFSNEERDELARLLRKLADGWE